ncbi:MAG: efflux transporter outer membrane subunit [Candidatus Eisenbacteria bacterium]
MSRILIASASFSLILLAGCGSAPKRATPETNLTVPPVWTAGVPAEEEAVDAWWSGFGSPVLDSLVPAALARNYDLAAALARLDAAAAEARVAGAGLWPSLDLSYAASRSRRNFIGFPSFGGDGGVARTTSNSHGVSLNSGWEIDLWGRVRAGKSAAAAEAEATLADLGGTRLSIAAQTAKAYFAAVEAQQQLRLARVTSKNYRLSADRIRSRFERGIRSSLDLRLALASLAASEALVELRRGQYDRAVRQLEILLGRYPRGDEALPEELPAAGAPVPAGLPDELLGRRPDLVAAERRVAASDARVRGAKRALLPGIRLTASGGRSSEEIKDLLDGDYTVWSIAGNLLQPLFQGGKLRANVDLAEARSRQALAAYASAVLRAFAEVESALASEEFLAAREEALRRATEQAVAARDLADERYRSGLADIVTVLESQRQALAAESEFLNVRRLRLDARVDLHLALGGGFDFDRALADRFAGERAPTTETEVQAR